MAAEIKPGSRTGSKTNVNETSMPLLLVEEENRVIHKNPEGGPTEAGKGETIELKEKGPEVGAGVRNGARRTTGEGKGRESPSFLDEMTGDLNLLDRDERRINQPVNLAFGDVIAEPEASQSMEGPWKFAFAAFTFVKSWVYSILAAIVGVPLAIVWGLIFSLISFAFIWVITPLLRVIDVAFSVIRRLVATFCTTFIEPIFAAMGAFFSQIMMRRHDTTISGQREQQANRLRDVDMA